MLSLFSLIQKGKDDYKLAATSDGVDQKGKKGKKNKDFDNLKKELEMVSTYTGVKLFYFSDVTWTISLFLDDQNTQIWLELC